MAAYADADSLALHLKRDLTDAEGEAVTATCAAVTDFIDRYVGQTWQGTAISGELQTVMGRIVSLDHRPVASVTSVTARSLTVGETPRVLVAGTGYELIDPLHGDLLVNEWCGTTLTVAYVTGTAVPPAIRQAADIIAAGYITGAGTASQARGIQKLKAGSVEITYDPIGAIETMLPPSAKMLLDAFRSAVVFA